MLRPNPLPSRAKRPIQSRHKAPEWLILVAPIAPADVITAVREQKNGVRSGRIEPNRLSSSTARTRKGAAAVWEVLAGTVLPIFAVAAIGFAGSRAGLFDGAMATNLNRFVFLVALPALIFGLVARAPFDRFDWNMLLGYSLSEALIYASSFALARYTFKCEISEAVLLGLASAFGNHVLFVLPVALLLFGAQAALPITAIIVVDGVVFFGSTLILMETLGESKPSPRRLLTKYAKNPQIVVMAAGLVVNTAGIGLPKGMWRFIDFVGGAAAPCALFALGVVLSQRTASGRRVLAVSVTTLKLILHPAVGWILIGVILQVSPILAQPAIMVAAAPSGLMALVLAMNYHVRVDVIARVILYSTVGSLVTISFIAARTILL